MRSSTLSYSRMQDVLGGLKELKGGTPYNMHYSKGKVCVCLYEQCGSVVMLTIIFNYHVGLSIRLTDLGDVLVSAVVEIVH